MFSAGQGWGQEAPVIVVGKITLTGNRVTRENVLLREIGVHEQGVYRKDSVEALILQTRLRLFNLQLFNEVEQKVVPISGDTVEWQIAVKERWYVIPTGIVQFADRNINTWWVDQGHDLKRVSAGLTIMDRNFTGRLDALNVTAQLGYTERFGISYLLPYIDRQQHHGIGVTALAAQSSQTYFKTADNKLQFAGSYNGPRLWHQRDAGIFYVYRPGYSKRHVVSALYRQFTVGDTIAQINPDFFADSARRARFVELNYRFEYNGVDNWNYSLTGEKLVVTTVLRSGWEGIGVQGYVHTEAGIFRRLGGRWYGAAIVRGRLMAPAKQPYYFRNGLGTQTDYVRGYEYYVTDGYQYGLMRLDLKRELFNRTFSFPLRYFTAIPLRIYPKIFVDAGYINNPQPGTNTLMNTWQYSVGAGIDIVTLYDVKIRIEYAYNRLGRNGVYLHFNSE